jgi:NTE family protein
VTQPPSQPEALDIRAGRVQLPAPGPVGLVLAGGGARGAYEFGALAELLPALPPEDRPKVVVGTSVGAINAAYLAARHNDPLDEMIEGGEQLWRNIRYEQVLEPVRSLGQLGRIGSYIGQVLQIPGRRLDALLRPSPLKATLEKLVPFERIEGNIGSGAEQLRAAAVVATSGLTNITVVFHQGGTPRSGFDPSRGIVYVEAEIGERHVRASAAIPTIFPAVEVPGEGWYFDGGTRLNTPIKPAIDLGAERVIIIALNSLARRGNGSFRTTKQPDALEGAAQLVQAVLVDPLVNDVNSLARLNEMIMALPPAAIETYERETRRKRIPYMLIAPEDPDEIGRLAQHLYLKHFAGLPQALSRDIALLGRLVDGGESDVHGELLSYMFFASEFTSELVDLGRRDARRWIETEHDEGLWQLERLEEYERRGEVRHRT